MLHLFLAFQKWKIKEKELLTENAEDLKYSKNYSKTSSSL